MLYVQLLDMLYEYWRVDSIRAYTRVGVSGYPSINSYPGFKELGCVQVSGQNLEAESNPQVIEFWSLNAEAPACTYIS